MERERPPAVLVLEGDRKNRAEAWRMWLKQFKDYLQASGMYKYKKDVQAKALLKFIGADGFDIYSTFKAAGLDDDIDVLIQKFNEYFSTNTNTAIARFEFFTRSQMEGEDIDTYVKALRILSQPCEFEHLEDSLIRDRIVCGIIDSDVSYKLLRTDGLTLEKAVTICKEHEVSKAQKSYNKVETKSPKKIGANDAKRDKRNRGASETELKELEAPGHRVGVHSLVPPSRFAPVTVQKIPQKNQVSYRTSVLTTITKYERKLRLQPLSDVGKLPHVDHNAEGFIDGV